MSTQLEIILTIRTFLALSHIFLKNKCKGYLGYIFTGNLELAKKIRLKPSRRIEFYNATIDCRLLEYEMYAGTKRTDKLVDGVQLDI